ncbi:MAG: phosphoribosyl-AMP cyclohydrolase [Candidatus Planktophila sp.]|nr:phosphoribosyl-AMP cyclohydrolase [Candidatus Planktophila sp.]
MSVRLSDDVAAHLKNSQELIPAIAQDFKSGEVLMLAYMNSDSLAITIETGRATYWSRSRNELWEKGATSGNTQKVISISLDCDGDALLLQVEQVRAACHTGKISCFHNPISLSTETNGKK